MAIRVIRYTASLAVCSIYFLHSLHNDYDKSLKKKHIRTKTNVLSIFFNMSNHHEMRCNPQQVNIFPSQMPYSILNKDSVAGKTHAVANPWRMSIITPQLF